MNVSIQSLQFSSIQELEVAANIPLVDRGVKIRFYANSMKTLYYKGFEHEADQQIEHAYIFYFKMATMWIEKLKKHPEFHTLDDKVKAETNDLCKKALGSMEKIHKILTPLYEKKKIYDKQRAAELELKRREEKARLAYEKKIEEVREKEEAEQRVENLNTLLSAPPAEEVKHSLKRIVIDEEAIMAFTQTVKCFSDSNIETCAILAGKEGEHGFEVTTFILPKQTGTAGSVMPTDDEERFQYQMENDLITLGWIHTHPNHDCFLSSVDLHTQLSYQLMLDEAIGIVVAPNRRKYCGIFHISKQGMDVIRKCPRKGFHPHKEPGIYGEAQHVMVRSGNPNYEIVDLR